MFRPPFHLARLAVLMLPPGIFVAGCLLNGCVSASHTQSVILPPPELAVEAPAIPLISGFLARFSPAPQPQIRKTFSRAERLQILHATINVPD